MRLGTVSVPVPPRPRAENPVDVRFTYDVNGLLQVEATAVSTGTRREVILEKNPGVLGADEIRSRLAALASIKVHPRDQQENIAVVARAERLYEELLWARDTLQDALSAFRRVLEAQDPREIATHRGQFAELLERIESEDGA